MPGGILEPVSGKSFLFFGSNYKTSDFMADGLLLWWQHRRAALPGVKQIVINLDNGPESNGRRSQFLLRQLYRHDPVGPLLNRFNEIRVGFVVIVESTRRRPEMK